MQIKKYFQVNLATAIIIPLLITSCNSDAPVMERPEKVYYDTAQRRMKANNFYSAIESLEAIEARYPFGILAVIGCVGLLATLSVYSRANKVTAKYERQITRRELSN